MENADNKVKKKDFIEIKFTGYANGEVFDSNVWEELKKINPRSKAKETIIIVGEGMLVKGLDEFLVGKDVGKDYEVKISSKDGFGERKRELIKTIPLKVFTEKKIQPKPGLVLNMDNAMAKVLAVSGARVITDFNNPLSGKKLEYKIKVVRIVSDEKEKAKVVLELLFRFVPDFEIKENKVIIKGPKGLGKFIEMMNDKFKELLGKGLGFEEVKPKEKAEEKKAVVEEKEEKKKDSTDSQ